MYSTSFTEMSVQRFIEAIRNDNISSKTGESLDILFRKNIADMTFYSKLPHNANKNFVSRRTGKEYFERSFIG